MQIQTYDKPGNLTTWAADINAAHADAVTHASTAIDYAKKAGELLLKVKQKLPHGAFGEVDTRCPLQITLRWRVW